MKKTVLLIVCLVAFATNGFAQRKMKGEKGVSSVGVIAGYAIESEKAVAGVDYRYNVLDRVRLAPSILYAGKKDYTDTWYTNVDVHYLARITNKATLYPLGGLGLSVWKYKHPGRPPLEEVLEEVLEELLDIDDSKTKTRMGLNLGFGGEVRATKDIICGAEFRYNWTSRYHNQAMILVRAAYYF